MRLVRLALSIVGMADAEDVAQEGLVTAWKKLPSLRQTRAFSSWVTRIVVRKCLRHAKRSPFLEPLADAPEPGGIPSPGASVDIERALAALAPRQRAVMHMTVIEGRTDSEIASILRMRKSSVRAHRRRAREKLEKWF